MKQIYKKDLYLLIKNFKSQHAESYYSGVAAELAFFFLWSLIPSLILLGTFASTFSVSLHFILEFITLYTPSEFQNLVIPYLTSDHPSKFNIFFLFFMFWLSSKGFFSLIRISNYAYNVNPRRTFLLRFKQMFSAMKLTFIIVFIILFSLLVPIYGRILSTAFFNLFFPDIKPIISDLWNFFKWPLSFFVFYHIMIYLYRSAPNLRKPSWQVKPGALFSTIFFLIASIVFSSYINNFSNYDMIYGSVASFIILMIWFYIMGTIIILGLHINVVTEQFKIEHHIKNIRDYIKLRKSQSSL